jgi:hypothetical protein
VGIVESEGELVAGDDRAVPRIAEKALRSSVRHARILL